MGDSSGGELRSAKEAFDRHDWSTALELLQEADARSPLGGVDLEMLAEAARWSRHYEVMLHVLERAESLHEQAGDRSASARVALVLCREHFVRNSVAEAAGWQRRAARLLEGAEECSSHGHLSWMVGRAAWRRDDFDVALGCARRTTEVGRRVGDADLEALGLHDEGHVLIARGDVEEGRALIDEAAAMGSAIGLMAAGTVYCGAIWAYRNMADWRRAGEWTDASLRWCERQSVSGFPGLCRFHRAEVRRLRGQLDEAERDALEAADELLSSAPVSAAHAFMEVGEIRRRRGDLAGAKEAFRKSHELGDRPQPGLALLQLDEGNVTAALASITEALSDTSIFGQELRATLLPTAVTAAVAANRVDLARPAVEELESLADTFGTPAVRAAAHGARGELERAVGDIDAATTSLRAACRLWCEVDAPYEAARIRVLLAEVLRDVGNEASAISELEAALGTFERLGAARQVADVRGRMATSGTRARRALVFTDIVDSTRLVETLGDATWESLLAWHDRTLRGCFADAGGEEVNHEGDGFFVAFKDPTAAIECAITIQRTLAAHRRDHGFAPRLRIGVHATVTIERDGDYLGVGVHEAARIGAAAAADEILVSSTAISSAEHRFSIRDSREVQLKGLTTPIEVSTIGWQ